MNEQRLNIRQFKMVNGEEIIALVNQKEREAYVVERPFKDIPNMMGGFTLLPWFPFSSQKLFKISSNHIMHHVEIDEDMKIEYVKLAATRPGLAKPALHSEEDRERYLTEFEAYLEEIDNDSIELLEDELKGKVIH